MVANVENLRTEGPIPPPSVDPTTATNDAVHKSAVAERDWVKGQLQVLEERLNGIDRATELRLYSIDDIPLRIDEKVANLRHVTDERFVTVKGQFIERDTRSERESRDNKVAVDAAFAAQKEAASEQNKSNTLAIDKSEKATAETLNKQADLFKSTTDALGAQIADVKERIGRMESVKAGGELTIGKIYAAVGVVGALISLVVLLVNRVGK